MHVNLESPVTIKHTYSNDIESLFYVFIWILILYDGLFSCQCEGIGHENNTLLSFWSEVTPKNLVMAQFEKFMFLIAKQSELHTQISLYFTELLLLAESWHVLLGQCVHKEVLMPFDKVFKIFNDFLAKMPKLEKPLVMASMLHKIVKQHSVLSSALPSHPTAKTDATVTKYSNMYPKCLHDEVRSMGNPLIFTKCFKAM